MTTIPSFSDVTDILDDDMIMVTHANGQSYKIAGSELNKRHKVIMADSTTVTGAPLKAGNCVRIYFTADITAVNATTKMQIKYNNVNYYVKVPKGGALENYVAFNLGGSPAVFKYVQAYTTLELLFDGTQFIIMCNPVVISGTNFSIYADGLKRVDEVTENSMDLVTSNAVAQKLTLNTSSDSTPYSQRVNADKDKSVINKLIGASFAINQLVKNGNFADSSNWTLDGATLSVSNGVASVTGSATTGGGVYQDYRASNGAKLLFMLDMKTQVAGTRGAIVYFGNTAEAQYPFTSSSTSFESFSFCASATTSGTYFRIRLRVQTGGNTNQYKNVRLIDLTQMFGSAIADRIYAMEQATAGSGVAWIKSFGFFNNAYYATDEGSIQNVKPSAYRTTGKNFLNVIGGTSEGVHVSNTGNAITANGTVSYVAFRILEPVDWRPLMPKGRYKITGNLPSGRRITISQINDGNWSSLAQAYGSNFTEFELTDSVQKIGITIGQFTSGDNVNLTFYPMILAVGNTDTTYKPYEQWNYPLADTELRGIPKLDGSNNLYFDGDIYYHNGDVIRRYGVVDLGSLTWGRDTATEGTVTGRFASAGVSANSIPQSINSIMSNGFSAKAGASAMQDKCYRIDNSKNLIITDTAYTDATAFKTAMNGVYLVYELATPTKETVTGYSNPHTLIRKGAEEFVDNRTIPIPVGHETEYAKLPDWLGDKSRFI